MRVRPICGAVDKLCVHGAQTQVQSLSKGALVLGVGLLLVSKDWSSLYSS